MALFFILLLSTQLMRGSLFLKKTKHKYVFCEPSNFLQHLGSSFHHILLQQV